MSLLSDAVSLIDSVTTTLGFKANVQLKRTTGDGGTGDPEVTTTTRAAIVEFKVRQVTTSDGRIVASSHTVTFLNPRVAVSEGDQITFQGKTNTVMSISSPVDTTGRLLTTAYL